MEELLTGLGKFGFDEDTIEEVFEKIRQLTKKKEANELKKEKVIPKEEDFLFLKAITCPICNNSFSTLVVKSGKARRIEPDFDLRPRFKYIDTNKYDVACCLKCGYAALNRDFSHVTPVQVKLINENVRAKYKPIEEKISDEIMGYDTAIERYKLAFYSSVVKRGRASERAYICLKISWLYRGKAEQLIEQYKEKELTIKVKKEIEQCLQEEKRFYTPAYEGLIQAMAQETFPICGMEHNTYELLLATMGYKLGKYENAGRLVSTLLQSKTASTNIKNRAYDLKEMIVMQKRKKNEDV